MSDIKEKCKEKLYGGIGWGSHGCSRYAKTDGYCKQHHPDNVKARREASQKKWKEDREKSPLNMSLRKIDSLEADNKVLTAKVERLLDGIRSMTKVNPPAFSNLSAMQVLALSPSVMIKHCNALTSNRGEE